jgi:hypothetical protein
MDRLMVNRRRAVLYWCCLAGMAALAPAAARDVDGRYAQSPLKSWFNQLKSKGGALCCSDADGTAISDVDWETKDGRYRVRVNDQWVDVPDEAVVTEPNKVGKAMVWPYFKDGHPLIRCFMPGTMI